MASLPRLTEAIVKRTCDRAGGKTAGWHALCSKGYLPAEIAIFDDAVVTGSDVRTRVREWAEKNELPIPASCARRREPKERHQVEDWREAFHRYCMRTGMVLHLTQPMIEYLCATAGGVIWDRRYHHGNVRPDNTLATAASLVKRGLIQYRARLRDAGKDAYKLLGHDDTIHELTDAGKCIVELLKVTGVFVDADAALRRAAEKGQPRK